MCMYLTDDKKTFDMSDSHHKPLYAHPIQSPSTVLDVSKNKQAYCLWK